MHGTSSASRAKHRRERGESLIEVLITVSIIGLGVVAIITATASTFSLSGVSRVGSHADQVLVRYAESLSALPYEPCTAGSTPYSTTASSAIPSSNLPDGITVGPPGSAGSSSGAFELSIVSVTYWNGDLTPATFSATCPTTDRGSQELTLRVHAGDGSFDRQMMIVKRAA
jgi:Tfp pilus assembly protein PilV